MTQGGLLPVELVRTWENYFRQKGGQGPDVSGQIVPVVVLDSDSGLPYAPFRRFQSARNSPAVAAQFSFVGIQNVDAVAQKSVVVVEWFAVRINALDDIVIAITLPGASGHLLTTLLPAADIAEEKDQAPSDTPLIGNVVTGILNQVGAGPSASLYPIGDTTTSVHTVMGPFTLGPGAELLVRTAQVNESLTVHFRGRYYSAL